MALQDNAANAANHNNTDETDTINQIGANKRYSWQERQIGASDWSMKQSLPTG